MFDQSALSRLRFIRLAQGLGFTLREIADFIRDASAGVEPCRKVVTVLDARLPQIGVELAQLQEMHRRMTRARRRWRRMRGGVPSGHEICRLIESEIDS